MAKKSVVFLMKL